MSRFRRVTDAVVLAWFADQPPSELFSTVVTVAEISYGLERLPRGRRRRSLEHSYRSIFIGMADHILAFDVEVALLYGPLVARKERAGVMMDPMGAQIACIAASCGAKLATRNARDFVDCGCSSSIRGAMQGRHSIDPFGIEAVSPLHDRGDQARHIERTPQSAHRHVQSMLIRIVWKVGSQLLARQH